jgi:hypothetical protein
MSPEKTGEKPSGFFLEWKEVFGETPPLGHILRYDFYENWTRFHALPMSKRYAETEGEKLTVLMRANYLACELFGTNNLLWVVVGYPEGVSPDNKEIVSGIELQHVLNWYDRTETTEDRIKWSFFAGRIHRTPTALDGLFSLAADGQEKVVFFDPKSGVALAPYDGGFDIIGSTSNEITLLELKFSSWVSTRSDRL